MLTGSLVAIVTPMFPDGQLDLERLRALIDWHITEGTDGIVVVGTTGESATVSIEEHCLLIKTAVDHAAGRIKIIAGTGANATREAIELTQFAKDAGADYALSVVPYYNKPSQEGLYRHFRAIAETVDLPLILYNVPGRTVADLAHETTLRLAEVDGIVGIKDATGNIARGSELLRCLPKSFAVYSGDDATTLALVLLGAHGTISVTANVAPGMVKAMLVAVKEGNRQRAIEINNQLLGLHSQLFLEANPIPVKWVLQQMGRIDSGIRLPLTLCQPAFHAPLLAAMRQAGLSVFNKEATT